MMLSTSAEYTMAVLTACATGAGCAANVEPRTRTAAPNIRNLEPFTGSVYRVTLWLRRNSDRGRARVPVPLWRRLHPLFEGKPARARFDLPATPGSTTRF